MQFVLQIGRRLWTAYDAFNTVGGAALAAATAYFFGLSLFPLLTVLVACVGLFLQYTSPGQSAELQVMQTVERQVSPVVAAQIKEMLGQVTQGSSMGGPLGLVMLLVTAIGGFSQFDEAFDRIWNVQPPKDCGMLAMLKRVLRDRLTAFIMLLSMGGLVVLAFIASTVMATVQARTSNVLPAPDRLWTTAQVGASLIINFGAFTVLYRWLPKVRVRFWSAMEGAAIVAVAWELGRQLLAMYLIGNKYSSAYGVVGTFIGLLVWCYYACVIIFIGAEYIRVCEAERDQAQAILENETGALSDTKVTADRACSSLAPSEHNSQSLPLQPTPAQRGAN